MPPQVAPFKGARILLLPSDTELHTDARGQVDFADLSSRRYLLAVAALGYLARPDSLVLGPNDHRRRRVYVTPYTCQLDRIGTPAPIG